MNFIERLIKLREEKKITNYRLSKDLGMKESSIRNWFKGRSIPRQKHMIALAEYFKVSPAWLQYGDKKHSTTINDDALRIANKIEEYAKKDPSFLKRAETMIDILGDSGAEAEDREGHSFQEKKIKKRRPAA